MYVPKYQKINKKIGIVPQNLLKRKKIKILKNVIFQIQQRQRGARLAQAPTLIGIRKNTSPIFFTLLLEPFSKKPNQTTLRTCTSQSKHGEGGEK